MPPPIALNRRRFLGCSAAAGFAISQGNLAEASGPGPEADPVPVPVPVRLAVAGVGNRGTTLLRTLLELPGTSIPVVCDVEAKHRQRGQGIVEKAGRTRPEAVEDVRRALERDDVDAVVLALPCDLHEPVALEALRAGKHVYAEKPLAPTLAGCDRLIAESCRHPSLTFHVGYQRRSNPRYLGAIDPIRRGELGPLIEARATWTSSNGPLRGQGGWLGRRARSGDFMVEQAVHVWDVLHWIAGECPSRAVGWGRRGLFARQDPGRDVTDHYAVELEWPGGLRASFVQSWIAPADDGFTGSSLRVLGEAGGLDFSTGILTFRDRQRPRQVFPASPLNETRLALEAFLASARSPEPTAPPLTLEDARAATLTGLLVRKAVDEQRPVDLAEVLEATGRDDLA